MSSIKRIKILDSLRGIAAFIVLIHHIYKLNFEEISKFTSEEQFGLIKCIADLNVEAVLFFFILSGFSIGLSLKDKSFKNKETINQYIYRRAKRILPIYWLSLGLSIFVAFLIPSLINPSYSIKNFIGNLLFLQTANITGAWFIPYGDNGPLWSLSYEIFYYLIAIPVLIFKEHFTTLSNSYINTIILFVLALIAILLNAFYINPFTSFLSLFPLWFIGFETANFYLKSYQNGFYFYQFQILLYSITLVISYYVSSSTIMLLNKGLLLIIFTMTIYMLANLNGTLLKISNLIVAPLNFVFFRFGNASFSIYLFHYIALIVFEHYKISLVYQIIGIIFLIALCFKLENTITKAQFKFLKRNYV